MDVHRGLGHSGFVTHLPFSEREPQLIPCAGVPKSISTLSEVSTAKKAKVPQPCQMFRKLRSGFAKHVRATGCKECSAFAMYLVQKESIARYLTAHRN
jgi:hypothetical protein